MNNPSHSVITLFNCNILLLLTDEEMFIGLRQRPEHDSLQHRAHDEAGRDSLEIRFRRLATSSHA